MNGVVAEMTKIASEIPEDRLVPVYISEKEYEVYLTTAVSIGRIVKKGLMWYTQDGMSFRHNKDAGRYLHQLYESLRQGKKPPSKEAIARRIEQERLEHISGMYQGLRKPQTRSVPKRVVQSADADEKRMMELFQQFLQTNKFPVAAAQKRSKSSSSKTSAAVVSRRSKRNKPTRTSSTSARK